MFSEVKMVKNALAAGAPPWIPVGELTALPNPLAGLKGREKDGQKEGEGWTGWEKRGGKDSGGVKEGHEKGKGGGSGREENGVPSWFSF